MALKDYVPGNKGKDGEYLKKVIGYNSPRGKKEVDLSPQNINKYMEFLIFFKRTIELDPHTAVHKVTKDFRVSGSTLIAMKNRGIVTHDTTKGYQWGRPSFEPNRQMSKELIEECRAVRQLGLQERKRKKQEEETEPTAEELAKQLLKKEGLGGENVRKLNPDENAIEVSAKIKKTSSVALKYTEADMLQAKVEYMQEIQDKLFTVLGVKKLQPVEPEADGDSE